MVEVYLPLVEGSWKRTLTFGADSEVVNAPDLEIRTSVEWVSNDQASYPAYRSSDKVHSGIEFSSSITHDRAL